MAFNSFRKRADLPPRRYRTPSPPLYDIETLSPLAFEFPNTTRVRKRQTSDAELRAGSAALQTNGFSGTLKGHSDVQGPHTAMDAFASIALATNTSCPMEERPHPGASRVNQYVTAEEGSPERASKRARSEKLRSPELHRAESRPSTSYVQSLGNMCDAELLVNFAQGAKAHFAKPTLPGRQEQAFDALDWQSGREHLGLTSQTLIPHQEIHLYAEPVDYKTSDAVSSPPEAMQKSLDSRSVSKNDAVNVHEIGSVDATDSVSHVDFSPPGFSQPGSKNNALDTSTEPAEPVLNDHTQQSVRLDQEADLVNESHKATSNADSHNELSKDICSISQQDPASLKNLEDQNGIEKLAKQVQSPDTHNIILVSEGILGGDGQKIAPLEEDVSPEVGSSTQLETANGQASKPSVCAACNFTRNSTSIESEDNATSWISCDGCKSWFHFACAGFKNEREVRGIDKYRCRKCKPIHGATTYVRKSSRAHTAIDYAGLNEGVLKTSDENPEHHYIKPIKDGTIKFQPETFPRMRPELVTAEFFERNNGMAEPVLIPASLHPRPGTHNPEYPKDLNRLPNEGGAPSLETPAVLDSWFTHNFEFESAVDHGQDALDMVIPKNLTVRKVSELYGPEERVEVIDVKSQNGEDKKWNMRRWVDYYESRGNKIVRNVISLEISQSKLGRLIRRPKIVRDLDLQDSVWPEELQAKGEFPKVQFYCLMSVADCYTDFHIDFGGSSVFYHILKGKKTFLFIPPKEKHLKKYEEWCMSPAQNWTFLGDQTKECYRVDLSEGDTMLIPAGWIHAVWTPEDSLVIGGNFLTRTHYAMQIRVAQIEKATQVARKFRYPHFQKVLWYTALRYLEDDPLPNMVAEALVSGNQFYREKPTYYEFDVAESSTEPGSENYHSRYYSQAELNGLPDLTRYLLRTAMIAAGSVTDGITVETRNAVKRSIPKTPGEPLDLVKQFALWCAWKRGNEPIPHWAYPGHVPEGGAPESAEKKLSAKAMKRLEREAALQAYRVAPERQSARMRSQQQTTVSEPQASLVQPDGLAKRKSLTSELPDQSPGIDSALSKKRRALSGSGTPRSRKPACESCRKKRRACTHREEPVSESVGPNAPDLLSTSDVAVELSATKPHQKLQSVRGEISNSGRTLQMSHVEIVRDVPSANRELNAAIIQIGASKPVHESNIGILSQIKNQNGLTSPIKTPGRSKACNDCRKSKRRCVHDEFGNEDPIKVREAPVPRASTKKRTASAAGLENKATKTPNISQPKVPIPRQPIENSTSSSYQRPPSETGVSQLQINLLRPDETITLADSLDQDTTQGTSPQRFLENQHTEIAQATCESPFENSLPRPGVFRQQQGDSTDTADDEIQLVATSPLSDLKVEADFESALFQPHQNFEQSATSLVSPPASLHTDSETTPPTTTVAHKTPLRTSAPPSRHSSRQSKQVQYYTPESGSARRPSSSTASDDLGKSASPAVVAVDRTPAPAGPALKRAGSRASMDANVDDEDSLRLIRELQAQDRGLRRRR